MHRRNYRPNGEYSNHQANAINNNSLKVPIEHEQK